LRIFNTKGVARFARREDISNEGFREAIERAQRGLNDADLGNGLIKQRVARTGQGRSGGYRTLIAFRAGDRAFFLLAFAKNRRSNIDPDELVSLRRITAYWLHADDARLEQAIIEDELQEISS
jgi:hypothetical protein